MQLTLIVLPTDALYDQNTLQLTMAVETITCLGSWHT